MGDYFMGIEARQREFFKIVKARSDENEKAFALLMQGECYALVGATIRMELDSLIRLFDYKGADDSRKEQLLDEFFKGRSWSKLEWKLVESMSSTIGWTEHIYKFCCAFVHLSPYHDWATNDNIPNLTRKRRRLIVQELRNQQNDTWGYDTTLSIEEDFTFSDLILFAPHIFKKLRGNLLCELGY